MCAIFGITGHSEAANLTYLGLHGLQHRGQEGAGIVTCDLQKNAYPYKGQGLVAEIFSSERLKELKGPHAIGHIRYSTTGESLLANLQPIFVRNQKGFIAIAHNGNLVNLTSLKMKLEGEGALFQTTTDTEVILHLMARSSKTTTIDRVKEALSQVEGAYSILLMTPDEMVAVRDPRGFRPLVLGKLENAWVAASETCAFDLVGAKFQREIQAGEIASYSFVRKEWQSDFLEKKPDNQKKCVFEFVYFARPDSEIFHASVYEVRKALGRQLALESPVPSADLVIPVPDSGLPAAIGFAEGAKKPFEMGIIRSHYVGRTFIEPKQSIRDFGVKLKLNPISKAIKDKVVVIVDDSLVRGTTSRKLIRHLREAGAREVHMRISAPPTTHPCYYGIDTPTREELLASHKSVSDISSYIGADSLGYLSLQGLRNVAEQHSPKGFCDACFSGKYPTLI